jgi:hypothetical protein
MTIRLFFYIEDYVYNVQNFDVINSCFFPQNVGDEILFMLHSFLLLVKVKQGPIHYHQRGNRVSSPLSTRIMGKL